MTPIEIESWALRITAAIQSGRPFEDTRLELKSEFITDPSKAARRIAAHANSAMGEPILWLIGVDQKVGVVGTNPIELSNWFAGVKAGFDGIYPPLRDVVIQIADKLIVALQFDTNRAPYLVKNPAGGAIQREIPWREGTQTRTATREEILLILQPESPAPRFEILKAQLGPNGGASMPKAFVGTIESYVVPRNSDRVIFPYHKCTGKIICDGKIVADGLSVRATAAQAGFGYINASLANKPVVSLRGSHESLEFEPDQVVVNRPSKLHFVFSGMLTDINASDLSEPVIEITLGLADESGKACVLTAHLLKKLPGGAGKDGMVGWRLETAT